MHIQSDFSREGEQRSLFPLRTEKDGDRSIVGQIGSTEERKKKIGTVIDLNVTGSFCIECAIKRVAVLRRVQ